MYPKLEPLAKDHFVKLINNSLTWPVDARNTAPKWQPCLIKPYHYNKTNPQITRRAKGFWSLSDTVVWYIMAVKVAYIWFMWECRTMESAWWLQMAWRLFGSRTSATVMIKVRSQMRGRRRAENWLQHKSLHVFTHARSRSGGGAEAEREQNPLRKKWVQHPICRVRFETARSKPSLSSRNGRSARVRSAFAPRMCEHTRGSGAGMSKSARLRSATAPRMCESSLTQAARPPTYHVRLSHECVHIMICWSE